MPVCHFSFDLWWGCYMKSIKHFNSLVEKKVKNISYVEWGQRTTGRLPSWIFGPCEIQTANVKKQILPSGTHGCHKNSWELMEKSLGPCETSLTPAFKCFLGASQHGGQHWGWHPAMSAPIKVPCTEAGCGEVSFSLPSWPIVPNQGCWHLGNWLTHWDPPGNPSVSYFRL